MTLLLGIAEDDPRKVSVAVNQALRGKINSAGTVTLTANAASTVVKNALVGDESAIILFPQTAHAAAELGNGTAYINPADYVNGVSFKITHANDANADKKFSYVILG